MSDLNKLRELAGLAPKQDKTKLDESAMGMNCNIAPTVSHRPQTDLDHFMRIVAEADSEEELEEEDDEELDESGKPWEDDEEEDDKEEDAKDKIDEMVVGDLSNGYGNHHSVDGDDYFPSGATSSVSDEAGPASAKHGDNPLQKSEKESVHEEMVHAYRGFIKG